MKTKIIVPSVWATSLNRPQLGETATGVAKRLRETRAGVSKSVSREEKVVKEGNLELLPS